MEFKHPSYYKKLRQQRKAASDMLNADNSERFVESAKPQAKGGVMEIKHPSYYKKLRQKRKATSDQLNAENSERFVESAKPQASSDKRQASSGTSSNKR